MTPSAQKSTGLGQASLTRTVMSFALTRTHRSFSPEAEPVCASEVGWTTASSNVPKRISLLYMPLLLFGCNLSSPTLSSQTSPVHLEEVDHSFRHFPGYRFL